jgi:hypothetical protein
VGLFLIRCLEAFVQAAIVFVVVVVIVLDTKGHKLVPLQQSTDNWLCKGCS